MLVVVGNGIGNPSSNPGFCSFCFYLFPTQGKAWSFCFFQLRVNSRSYWTFILGETTSQEERKLLIKSCMTLLKIDLASNTVQGRGVGQIQNYSNNPIHHHWYTSSNCLVTVRKLLTEQSSNPWQSCCVITSRSYLSEVTLNIS